MPILTENRIAAIKPQPRPFETREGTIGGLSFVRHPSGLASWSLRYRYKGRTRKLTLGRHPGLDLKAARVIASKAYAAVCDGRDPGAERKAARRAAVVASAPIKDQVEKVAALYLRHARARLGRRHGLKPSASSIGKSFRHGAASAYRKSQSRTSASLSRASPSARQLGQTGYWRRSRPFSPSPSSIT